MSATASRWWAGRHGDRHGATGYPTGFALAAALMLVAIVPALHDRRWRAPAAPAA